MLYARPRAGRWGQSENHPRPDAPAGGGKRTLERPGQGTGPSRRSKLDSYLGEEREGAKSVSRLDEAHNIPESKREDTGCPKSLRDSADRLRASVQAGMRSFLSTEFASHLTALRKRTRMLK